MPGLQPARGTQDLLPEVARRHRRVSETARELAALYGFAEIATPIWWNWRKRPFCGRS